MKKYKREVQNILFKAFDITELIADEKIWIDITSAYCECNPENEEAPVKISLLLDNVVSKHNELHDLMEEFTNELHRHL